MIRRSTVDRAVGAAAAICFVTGLNACGTTTIDETVGSTESSVAVDGTTAPGADGSADSGATPTPGTVATVVDRLTGIGTDMARLNSQIDADGDEDATLQRIETAWAEVEDEVAAERPDLIPGIQATIDMAQTAVDANRPADSDKAYGLLKDLIAEFESSS